MLRKILTLAFVIVLSALSSQLSAQKAVIARISQVAKSTRSLQADFVQTKYMKMLGDKMVSKGKMYYQQDPSANKNGQSINDKLRWEYTSPYQCAFIINGNNVLIKKAGAEQKVNRMFKEVAKFMINSIQGNCLTDTKNFKVSIVEQATDYVATLIPQKKRFSAVFPKIVFVLSKKTGLASVITMYEKNGDRTEIVLKNVQVNRTITPDKFM